MFTFSLFHTVRGLALAAVALVLALGTAAGTAASAFAQDEPPSTVLPEPGGGPPCLRATRPGPHLPAARRASLSAPLPP